MRKFITVGFLVAVALAIVGVSPSDPVHADDSANDSAESLVAAVAEQAVCEAKLHGCMPGEDISSLLDGLTPTGCTLVCLRAGRADPLYCSLSACIDLCLCALGY